MTKPIATLELTVRKVMNIFDRVAPAQSYVVPLNEEGAGLPLFCFPRAEVMSSSGRSRAGGLVAYQMATRLIEEGDSVTDGFSLRSGPPGSPHGPFGTSQIGDGVIGFGVTVARDDSSGHAALKALIFPGAAVPIVSPTRSIAAT